ncbi:hypothetical protein J6590_092884, partial [Homalodisca vitripennis]
VPFHTLSINLTNALYVANTQQNPPLPQYYKTYRTRLQADGYRLARTISREDKPTFYRNGAVNRRNHNYDNIGNPHIHEETPLNLKEFTVWGAIS